MIITEQIEKRETRYIHTYSDAGMMIERDGLQYVDAIDPIASGRTYTETNIPIDPDSEGDEEAAYAEAGKILMGVIE